MSAELKISAIEQYVIKYVTDLRIAKNLTQDNIAAIIGVSRSFINNIESGKSRAKYNLTHIDKLADHFGLSPKDFLPAIANRHL